MSELSSREIIIEMEGINQRYKLGTNTIDALSDINIKIHLKEFTMVMGPSGSGKSTLLNTIAGLEAP